MTRLRHRTTLFPAAVLAIALTTLVTTLASAAPDDEAPQPVETPAPIDSGDPFGLPTGQDLIDGGAPIPSPDVQLVERFAITPVGANDPNGVSNRPEFSYTGEGGSVIDDAVTVFNLGNNTLNFGLYGTDARNDESGAFSLIGAEEAPTDVGSWIELSQDTVTVDPGMAATIPFTLTIPDDATPGDHIGAVVASSPTVGETADGSFLEIDRRTSTRLYLRVDGPIRAELAVENLSTAYETTANPLSGTAKVTYRIQNRGNVRLGGRHSVSVAGPFGIGREATEAIDFPELLPGQGIDIEAELAGVPALLRAVTKVSIEPAGGDAATASTSSSSSSGVSLALPVTVLLLMLVVALAWFARLRFKSRQREDALDDFEVVEFESAPHPA
jgi:hypothetical protein